jgi:ADP-ribose pyrophosphatase YjhB (NUDIX family)
MGDLKFIMTKAIVAEYFPDFRIRAGVLLIHNDAKNHRFDLLLVEEESGNFGPPKCLVDWSRDKSVFEAAFRGLQRETGLNVLNKSVDICRNVFVYRREHHKELIVYYAAFVRYSPRVHLQSKLLSYTWTNLCDGLSGRYSCSESSNVIFRAIDNSLLFRTTNVINIGAVGERSTSTRNTTRATQCKKEVRSISCGNRKER